MVYKAIFFKQDFLNPVLIVLGWTLYGLFFASQSYLQQVNFGQSSNWRNPFLPWLTCAYTWAMLTPLILVLASRFPLTLKAWRRTVMIHIPSALAFSLFQPMLYLFVWQLLFGHKPGSQLEQYSTVVAEELHAGILIYFTILTINFGRTYLQNRRSDARVFPLDALHVTEYEHQHPSEAAGSDLSDHESSVEVSEYVTRIIVKQNGRTVFVKPSDIDWINSEGNYVKLHTPGKRYLIRETMNAMEQKLDPRVFVRIRRSIIVRTQEIIELRPALNGGVKVVLKDGTILHSSRRCRKNLESILKLRLPLHD